MLGMQHKEVDYNRRVDYTRKSPVLGMGVRDTGYGRSWIRSPTTTGCTR